MAVELIVDTSNADRALAAFEDALSTARTAEAVALAEAADDPHNMVADLNAEEWTKVREALERLHAAITDGEPT